MQGDVTAKKKNRAFTLVELLVSITVMIVILGVTMTGAPRSLVRVSLSDNVYQTEVLLREAQLQGSAVNSLTNVFGGAGVLFDKATSTKVLKFKDRVDLTIVKPISVGNGIYNTTPIDEKDTVYSLVNGNRIASLCLATSSLSLNCDIIEGNPINTLTISFTRPKQNADIYKNGATSTKYSIACIQLDSVYAPANGYVKSIFVYQSGMIVKKNSKCL